jgi:hypothetical protein
MIDGVWSIGRIRVMGRPKYSEKNRSQCHFVHRKFYMYRSGNEPEPPL